MPSAGRTAEPQLVIQVADHPEIEERKPSVVRDEKISRVRVCVKETGLEDLGEQAFRSGQRQRHRVRSRRERPRIGEPHAVDALHDEHPLRRHRPVDGGDNYGRLVRENLPQTIGVAALTDVIELGAKGPGKVIHNSRQIVEGGESTPTGTPGEVREDDEVLGHGLCNSRLLHLDHHPHAIAKNCSVHLSDRGRRERISLELGEEFVRGCAQFRLNDPQDRLRRHRWHAITKLLELHHVLGANEVRPGAEDLAQLDGRCADVFHGQTQVFGRRVWRFAPHVAKPAAMKRQGLPDSRLVDEGTQPVA